MKISNGFLKKKKSIKGPLDKYSIYLFISTSIEELKSNQYRNFQLILPMHFDFEVFCEQYYLQCPTNYCIVSCLYLLKSILKNRKC